MDTNHAISLYLCDVTAIISAILMHQMGYKEISRIVYTVVDAVWIMDTSKNDTPPQLDPVSILPCRPSKITMWQYFNAPSVKEYLV